MQKASVIEKKYLINFIFVTSLFLMWGVLYSMSDVLNKIADMQSLITFSK